MKVELPARKLSNPMSIESALDLRETKREFSSAPLSLQHIGQLLWAAQGKREGTEKLTTPSAGAQYPLRILLVAKNVSGTEPGIYRYNKSSHALEQVRRGEFNRRLGEAALGEQPWVADAAAIIVVAADFESIKSHYAGQPPKNKRGERYVYMETGALAQNVQLQGTSLSIDMVLVGAFDDTMVKTILMLPEELEPTALLCVGRN